MRQLICAFTAALMMCGTARAQSGAVIGAPNLDRQLVHQRGVEAVIWGIPLVGYGDIREGIFRDLGGHYNDIVYFSDIAQPRHEFLTPNNQTPYVIVFMSLKDGPVVLDVPPASEKAAFFGTISDAWQVPLADAGPAGEDEGKGGRYLLLPPGYKEPVPAGHIAVPSSAFNVGAILRPVAKAGGKQGIKDAAAYAQTLKVYPLSQAASPPPNRYIDAFPKTWRTLPPKDAEFFRLLAQMIEDEPVQEKDKVMMGMLRSLGIEKDKPFNPDAQMLTALTQAAADGWAMLDFYLVNSAGARFWPDRRWEGFKVSDAMASVWTYNMENYLSLDERAGVFQWAIWPPKKFGKGTFYLLALKDDHDRLLDGSLTYRLHVPADTPVRDFWSAIVYSTETRAFVYSPSSRTGVSSNDKSTLKLNADGSVDVYFAPAPPKGWDSNWIPTEKGKGFFVMFRFYGPEPAVFQKTWKLPDIVEVQ